MMHGNVWKRLWTDRAMAAVAISQMTCEEVQVVAVKTGDRMWQEVTGSGSLVEAGGIREGSLTVPLSTNDLMTVPNRRTSFWTSEEPVGVTGTFWMTSREFQVTGEKFSCSGHIVQEGQKKSFQSLERQQQFSDGTINW